MVGTILSSLPVRTCYLPGTMLASKHFKKWKKHSILWGALKSIQSLTGGAQWTECGPMNQRVASSIPSQGTCLGCGPGPQLGTPEGQPYIDVSPPLLLLPGPSL